MSSLKSVLANVNKLAAANDFTTALSVCEKALETEDGRQFFPLVSMQGYCFLSIGKYEKAEKSFVMAKSLEAKPQLHQKNVKYLADTYEHLGKWKQHAEELKILYAIAKK